MSAWSKLPVAFLAVSLSVVTGSGILRAQSAATGPVAPVPASGVIPATSLTGTSAVTTTASVSTATGGAVIAGSVGVALPAGFTSVPNANVTITPTLPAGVSISALAGSVVGSPNGTNFELSVVDPATGAQIQSFNTPITSTVKPNDADLTIALSLNAAPAPALRKFAALSPEQAFQALTVIYFTASNTLPVFNPLGLPPNTPVFQPGVVHNADGTLSWSNQNGAGLVQAVVANPITYVQTVSPNVQEFSSFDPGTSQSFGAKPQFSYLQVTEPQIPGVNRLVVLDPDTGNYSYVNATDVAPSGPPPAKSSAAVVRGLVKKT